MKKNKSSISEATTYKDIGEFWDGHEISAVWDSTKDVKFDVEINTEVTYFPVESNLTAQLSALAKQRGVSPETLLNLWILEKVREWTTR
jgi:hypothetical protein